LKLENKNQKNRKTHKSYFFMSVASLFTPCFVMFCVFLYGPFCHGAHKLDLSTLFTTFFLWTSLPFIFNKTEAAVFSCRLCFLRAFLFISLIQNARCTQKMSVNRVNRNNTILHRTFYTITASEHILKAFYKCT